MPGHGEEVAAPEPIEMMRPVLRNNAISPMQARVNTRDASRPAPIGRAPKAARRCDVGIVD